MYNKEINLELAGSASYVLRNETSDSKLHLDEYYKTLDDDIDSDDTSKSKDKKQLLIQQINEIHRNFENEKNQSRSYDLSNRKTLPLKNGSNQNFQFFQKTKKKTRFKNRKNDVNETLVTVKIYPSKVFQVSFYDFKR